MSIFGSTADRHRAHLQLRGAMVVSLMIMAFLVLMAISPYQARAVESTDTSAREEYFPMEPFFHDSCGVTDDSYAFPAQPVEGSEHYTSEGGVETWYTTHRGEFGDYNVADSHREGVRWVVIGFVLTDPTKDIGAPREGVDHYWIDSSQGADAAVWSYTYNNEPCPTEGPITQPTATPTSEPTSEPTPSPIEATVDPTPTPTPTVSSVPSTSPTSAAVIAVKNKPLVKSELAVTGVNNNPSTWLGIAVALVIAGLMLFAASVFGRRKQHDK